MTDLQTKTMASEDAGVPPPGRRRNSIDDDDDDENNSNHDNDDELMRNPHPPLLHLLVTAHPDDESMFFVPTVRSLLRRGDGAAAAEVRLLCLSNGDYDGLGQIREIELRRASSILGLLSRRRTLRGNDECDDFDVVSGGGGDGGGAVTVLDDLRMRDGPQERWDADVVADTVWGAAVRYAEEAHLASTFSTPLFATNDDRSGEGVEGTERRRRRPAAAGAEALEGGDGAAERSTRSSALRSRRRRPLADGGDGVVDSASTIEMSARRRDAPSPRRRSAAATVAAKEVILLTFDERGVSGHPNHVDVHRGVRRLLARQERRRQRKRQRRDRRSNGDGTMLDGIGIDANDEEDGVCLRAYELCTISNPLLKYAAPLVDVAPMLLFVVVRTVWSWLLFFLGLNTMRRSYASSHIYCGNNGGCNTNNLPAMRPSYQLFEPRLVWAAMAAHTSQFVWYRRLSVLFSRYTYTNSWREINVCDDDDNVVGEKCGGGKEGKDEGGSLPEVIVEEETSRHGFDPVPPILTLAQMRSLASSGAIPSSVSNRPWKRLYCLARDGDSFESFLRNVKGWTESVLVLRTGQGDVLGAYADGPWEAEHQTEGGGTFYGGACACLFKFVDADGVAVDVRVYKWTGANRCLQACDRTRGMIALGGGGEGGSFGLCVEDDFRRGSTGHCDTFDNDALCECDAGCFSVVDLEVWGFPRAVL